ncbi:reverse transcriptase domain-containing protein [Tanacetum coccineum]
MPPRRNRPLTEAYEQEFEQRVMARMKERLDQFVDQLADRMNDMMNLRRRRDRNSQGSEGEESENPFFDSDGSSSDEQPDRPRRNQRENNRRWESGMRVNIPEFDGNTLNRRVGSSSSPAITGGSSGSGNVTSRFVPNQTKVGGDNTGLVYKGVGSSGLKCFNCGEPGHR